MIRKQLISIDFHSLDELIIIYSKGYRRLCEGVHYYSLLKLHGKENQLHTPDLFWLMLNSKAFM